jgi:hypothetical protein
MNTVDTIDPKDITLTVAGKIIDGFVPDKIKVMRVSNQVEDEVGADGDVARRITNDRRGEIAVTLLQTSRSNLILSGLARLDEITGGSTFPLVIKDNRGKDLHVAAIAWITKMPEAAYRAGVEMRVWTLRTNNIEMFLGGAA